MGSAKPAFLFLAALLVAVSATYGSHSGDLSVMPIYGGWSPFNAKKLDSMFSTVMDMASRDSARAQSLMGLGAQVRPDSVPIAAGGQVLNISTYVVRARIGTPVQLLFMVLDTSSDRSWVPCDACTGCSSTTFSSNKSSTFGPVGCSAPECTQARGLSCPAADGPAPCLFNQSYGGDSSFSANLVKDTLTLNADVVNNFTFGCISSVTGGSVPPQGLLGLGRGYGSLMTQGGSLFAGVFSYCLPSFKSSSFSGTLLLGPMGQPKDIKTTPLLQSTLRPNLYYVNLTGISVGQVHVPAPAEGLAFNPATGAGTIVDSGTVITRFARPVYEAVRLEFRKQVKGTFTTVGAFDTCFAVTQGAVAPAVTLHFEGMDVVLPTENTLIQNSGGSVSCLAMAASSGAAASLNIIASLQQQNLRMVFDVANSKLGIISESCN